MKKVMLYPLIIVLFSLITAKENNEPNIIISDSLDFINSYNNTIYVQSKFLSLKLENGNGELYSLKEYSKLIDDCSLAEFKYNNYKKNFMLFLVGYVGGLVGITTSTSSGGHSFNKSQFILSTSIAFGSIYFGIKSSNNFSQSVWEYNKCVLSESN